MKTNKKTWTQIVNATIKAFFAAREAEIAKRNRPPTTVLVIPKPSLGE